MLQTLTLAALGERGTHNFIARALAEADVQINGSRPWDLRVHDSRMFRRILFSGSLGLGESFIDRQWDCSDLDGFFTRVLQARLDERYHSPIDWLDGLRGLIANRQRRSRSSEVARRHYDLHPELYRAMLGEERVYSCGYWRTATTLEEAQTAKIDLCCRKLGLEPGMRLLDIGCGWGALARHAAERYGVEVVGITVSCAQAEVARERCRGLPITIREQDYRALNERFDRIVSVGMFEHVGPRNYRTYFDTVRRCLPSDGLFLLHTIGANGSFPAFDPWLDRYIFPNAVLPSAKWIHQAVEGRFVIEDWHHFGPDYDRTLMAWYHRLHEAWDALGTLEARGKQDDRAWRVWRYYLLACAGSFRARKSQLWQVLMSPHGRQGGCPEVR